MLRRFHFERLEDKSGIGKVAYGVMFDDGQIALHWEGTHTSINIFKSIDDLIFVHGHQGATQIVFDDPEEDKISEVK